MRTIRLNHWSQGDRVYSEVFVDDTPVSDTLSIQQGYDLANTLFEANTLYAATLVAYNRDTGEERVCKHFDILSSNGIDIAKISYTKS